MKMKKNQGLFIVLAVIVFFIISQILIYKCRDLVIQFFTEPEPQFVTDEMEIEYEQTYITETAYDGSKELHPALFSIPFKKSEYYICNKDLIKNMSKEKLKKISKRSEYIAEELFNINSADVSASYDEKEQTYKNFFQLSGTYMNDDGEWYDVKGFIADYLKTAAESGLEIKSDFDTDFCLVYQDAVYYVRGMLNLEVINVKDTEGFRRYFDIPLEEGHKYEIIYEIGIAPYSGDRNQNSMENDSREPENMRLVSFELLKVITNKNVEK